MIKGQPNYWNLYVKNSDFKFYKDNIYEDAYGNIIIDKNVIINHSIKSENADNTANVALDWSPSGVARVRVGGGAPGATNGFQVQSPGDYVEMYVKHNNGGVWTRGVFPLSSDAYNVGNLSNKFNNAYFSGDILCSRVNVKKLYMDIERAWMFEQGGSGAGTSLDLVSQTNGKAFKIMDTTKTKGAEFYTSSDSCNFSLSGSITPWHNNQYTLGRSDVRWQTIYSINALNTSDVEYKENIEYLDSRLQNNIINQRDLHEFYKNRFKLSKYNYKSQSHEEYGFIAQDLAKDEVGRSLIIDSEDGYMYSIGSYVSSIAGALQHEINLRDEQILELHERISTLENNTKSSYNKRRKRKYMK